MLASICAFLETSLGATKLALRQPFSTLVHAGAGHHTIRYAAFNANMAPDPPDWPSSPWPGPFFDWPSKRPGFDAVFRYGYLKGLRRWDRKRARTPRREYEKAIMVPTVLMSKVGEVMT